MKENLKSIFRNPVSDKACIENLLFRGDMDSLYAVKMIQDYEAQFKKYLIDSANKNMETAKEMRKVGGMNEPFTI